MSGLEPGQKVHLAQLSPWRAGVDSYFGSDPVAFAADVVWELPERGSEGDIVIVLLDARDRAVFSVEYLTAPWDMTDPGSQLETEGSEDAMWSGVSVTAVELRMGEPVPAAPATLDDAVALRLLAAIGSEERAPTPWYRVDVTGCADVVVQRDADLGPWQRSAYECFTCGLDVRSMGLLSAVHSLETHRVDEHDTLDGSVPPGTLLRLCGTCHTVLHQPIGPTLAALASSWRPRCPDEYCGAKRTLKLVWGLPAFPLPPGTVSLGCTIVLEAEPPPRYRCEECGHEWSEQG